jgi:hypothetical protein
MNYFCGEKNSQMRKPKMEVIRFTESDIVVASGSRRMATSFSLTNVNSGGIAGDGIARYNNSDYLLNSKDAVNTFISALGVSDAGIDNGRIRAPQSLVGTLNVEATKGTIGNWDGTYTYDPNASWTNKDGDTFQGVFFIHQ